MEIWDEELKDIVEFVKGTPRANQVYGSVVNDLLRQEYKADKVESIINNYLDDMTNVEHKKEFDDLQAYRKECKRVAKEVLEID